MEDPSAWMAPPERDRAKPEAKVVGGVYSVDPKGNVLAQVNEHHAMIQFHLRVRSTHLGSNDRLEWLGHALLPKDAHLLSMAEQAVLAPTVFEVPTNAEWNFKQQLF